MRNDSQATNKTGTYVTGHDIKSGRKIVTTTGTAEPISATVMLVDYVLITAETNNTGVITVGDSDVVAAVGTREGTPLNAGDHMAIPGVNLEAVYLDTTVSGDGITYIFVK